VLPFISCLHIINLNHFIADNFFPVSQPPQLRTSHIFNQNQDQPKPFQTLPPRSSPPTPNSRTRSRSRSRSSILLVFNEKDVKADRSPNLSTQSESTDLPDIAIKALREVKSVSAGLVEQVRASPHSCRNRFVYPFPFC
jgi:hypothetical protein